MKPSQFLYSESIKDQKAQKANLIKPIEDSKQLPQTANHRKDQNSSTIYSLVNLPFKEGQNDQVIFPPSLISQTMRVDPRVVVGKNTELARSLKKLKPLETQDSTLEQAKFGTVKSNVVDQSLQGPKLQTYLKVLNDLTNGLFKKTQSQLLFGSIEQKITKSTALCVLRIQQLKFFNEYNSKNDKIPACFSWEALYRKKSLMKTTPKEFDAAQQDLLDFLYQRNAYESVDIVLWKIKNNDEKYIGQFEISNADYLNSKEVLDFKSKYITETFVEKEMYKNMKQTKSFIGNVKFQLIQLADAKIPLNQHSGIPGSPRTEEEKERHRIIDAAMSGQEYKWHIDDQERIVLQKIDIISQETIAECTISVVQDECGELYIVFESKYTDPDTNGRSRPTSRQMKKQHFEATMNLLKELDKNGVFTEVQGNLRSLSRQGKLSRKAVEDALQTVGCTANQLLLTASGEFGDCLMDFLLNTDDLPGVLEAMQEVKLIGEEEQNLESFSTNLFQNIGQHLRKSSNMKSVIEFIKALEKKPEVGLLIYNYSYASENVLSSTPPFLQNFDSRNYEHVMVLGKLNKMIGKFGINTKFTQALKKTHTEAKKEIYFEIPCFPKDLDLYDKADSLQLKEMGQNVMHEIVRRQKWSKSHTIFEKYPEWFFVADEQDHTPFCLMLEQAPFDVIKSLLSAYTEQLQNIFSKFDPNNNLYESRVPKKEKEEKKQGEGENEQGEEMNKEEKKKLDEDEIYEIRKQNQEKREAFKTFKDKTEYKKNIIHNLLLNANILQSSETSLSDLKDILRSIEQLVNQSSGNNFEMMKAQKLRAGDFTPLGLYLEIIRSKLKRKQDRILREIGSTIIICQILTPKVDTQENTSSQEQSNSFFEWTPQNQLIISQIIAKFPENIFERLDEEGFAKKIFWIPPIEELKSIRYINLPLRTLIKHKQQHKLFSLAQQMNDELKNIKYNPADFETDDNKKLLYYFQIQTLMILEIRNLRSQKLDQVVTQLFSYLRDFTLAYPELLVAPMPQNITSSYYPFKHFYKGSPKSLLDMLNLIKYNLLLVDIPVQQLDKLNVTLLATALSNCKDPEPLRNFFKLVLAKDKSDSQGQPEEEKFDRYNKELFQVIANPSIIFTQESEKYIAQLKKQQIEQLLLTQKEKILALLSGLEQQSRFVQDAHSLILRSFLTRKSVGITQQQVALWMRNDFEKIHKKWINLYLNYFRSSLSLQQIHILIDLVVDKPKMVFLNQAKIQPYLLAQGQNWAAILELKKFEAAIKDNIQYVDLQRIVKCVALNGQYEKLEILLPYVKDSILIKNAIHMVSKIANLQIFNQQKYYDEGRPLQQKQQQKKVESPVQIKEPEQNENQIEAPSLAEAPQAQSQQESQLQGKKKLPEKTFEFSDFYIRCYDPTVYFFRSPVKQKKEKYAIELIKFPEALEKIRTPLSLQDQLKEISPSLQLEIDDFLKNSFSKCNRISLNLYENSIERDVVMFRFLKNWKSSLQRQNRSAIFTSSYDSGAGQQSYKKVLSLLLKQFQRYGMPMCDTANEFELTFQVLMTYGLLNIEQIISQISLSKLSQIEKNKIYIKFLTTILGKRSSSEIEEKKSYKVPFNFYSELAEHYQYKNGNTSLSQISRVINQMNAQLFDEEMKEYFRINIIGRLDEILKIYRPEMLNDRKALLFKVACEILLKLDKIDIKSLYEEKLIEISNNIKIKNFKDKSLLIFANKYSPEPIEQKVRLSSKEVIAKFKKLKLEEALQTDITTYFAQYPDNECEEIVTELFNRPYNKQFQEDLLNKFDYSVFEGLIFFRKYRTYNKLIHDILQKQLLKGNEDLFKAIIAKVNILDLNALQEKKSQANAKKFLQTIPELLEQNKDFLDYPKKQITDQTIADVEKYLKDRWQNPEKYRKEGVVSVRLTHWSFKFYDQQFQDPYSIPQMAVAFNFYEYFETLHRLKMKAKVRSEAFCGNRLTFQTNEQLLEIGKSFEKQQLNYLSNCVQLLYYLRLNGSNFEKHFHSLETDLFTAFIAQDSLKYPSACMNIIDEYLNISSRESPVWQNTLLSKSNSKNFTIMKLNGIERGVKFCFPSNYNFQEEEVISIEDIRKAQMKKPVFTIDQYLQNLGAKAVSKLKKDNSMINDPQFFQTLKKLKYPFKQPEFLVQLTELYQDFKTILFRNDTMYYYFLNFPTFWYKEKIPKEQLTNRYFFYDFELGIVLLRATMLLEPKLIDQILEIYFLSLNTEFTPIKNEDSDGVAKDDNIEKVESEYEEYEVEVTDDEADGEQQEQQEQQEDELQQKQDSSQQKLKISEADDQAKEDQPPAQSQDEAPQVEDLKPDAPVIQKQQSNEQPKVKKTKKVMQKRKKQKGLESEQWVEPKSSLRVLLQNECNTYMQFQIFLQLLLFASTNEEMFRLVQKYFIQYGMVHPQAIPLEIDPIRKARMIKDGFKEPFNQQLFEQMEAKVQQLTPQQIDDIQYMKQVITKNENQRHSEQSEVYQILLTVILSQKKKYEGYNNYIKKLLNSAAFQLLTKYKKQLFSQQLETDQKFQQELRNYYSKVENIQLSPDFILYFFQSSKQASYVNQDKWVSIIYLLQYCSQISNQISEFKAEVELAKEQQIAYQSTACEHYKGYYNKFEINCQYLFRFKVTNKFEPIIYEYKIETFEEQNKQTKYNFNFELTFNIQKSNSSFIPTTYLSEKYVEEIIKITDKPHFDDYLEKIGYYLQYQYRKVAQISESDDIDYNWLKAKLTQDNFREYLELHNQHNFFLDDTIKSLHIYGDLLEKDYINSLKILTQLREAIVLGESNDFTQMVKINNINWNLYSERIRPEIKLKYQEKLYPLPYTNYQPRHRNTQYQQSIQVDKTFPELYPIVNLQVYQYFPEVITEEQFNQRFDSLTKIQQACFDLNSYAQSLEEFVSSLPSQEELENLRRKTPQIISWPIMKSKVKGGKRETESYKFTHSPGAHPLFMIEYLYSHLQLHVGSSLQYTFNVLSITEILLFKLTRIIQQTTGKKCKISTTIDMIDDWALLKKILLRIEDLLQGNELDKFKFYYVEFNEVHQNAVYNQKSNKFEGLDAIFRFGQTQFFVHSNVLIIRLNLAVISENATSLITAKNPKLKALESSQLLFKEDKDIRSYMSQIVTLEDMLKQIFMKT